MNNKNNLSYLIIISLSLIAAIAGYLMTKFAPTNEFNKLGWNLLDYGTRTGSFIGIIMLLTNGTFIKTRYFKIAQGILSIVIIGVLFKIMHWLFGNLILTLGLTGIALTYIFSFLIKPIKKRLDYLKAAWVFITFTLTIFSVLHINRDDYSIIGTYLLGLLIIDFTITSYRNTTLFPKI